VKHGTAAQRDHHAIGKADPLTVVLIEQLVADSPIRHFVFAPVRMDLSGYFRRQLVGNALHQLPGRGSAHFTAHWSVSRVPQSRARRIQRNGVHPAKTVEKWSRLTVLWGE
jgi:hypothetical protein